MDLARVAGGGHVGDAADNDEDDGDDAGNGDDVVQYDDERSFDVATAVGFVDDVGNEGNDDFGETDDGEADEGVEDGVLGLLELTGIAGRGDVLDATDDDEGSGNYAADADEPADGIGDELFWGDTLYHSAVVCEFIEESNMDGIDDDFGETDDGEANESVGQGFLAGGDFTGVARGEDIKVAAIDDVADNEVSRDCGDVFCNVGDDETHVALKLFLAAWIFDDATVPSDHTEEVAAVGVGLGG